jgi:hypothetical protein
MSLVNSARKLFAYPKKNSNYATEFTQPINITLYRVYSIKGKKESDLNHLKNVKPFEMNLRVNF